MRRDRRLQNEDVVKKIKVITNKIKLILECLPKQEEILCPGSSVFFVNTSLVVLTTEPWSLSWGQQGAEQLHSMSVA